MSKVLVLKTTAQADEVSNSVALTNRFLEEYKKFNPDDEIIIVDLNKDEVGTSILTSETFPTFYQQEVTKKYINLLKSVDKLVIACPMYNFSTPATLKSFIDHVSVANETFSYKYSKKGDAIGLITNLKAQILGVQGAPLGWYPWGQHTQYVEEAMRFLGIEFNKTVLLAGVKVAPLLELTPAQRVETIIDEVTEAAKTF
ncbi:FMN-dependent NADH-azoreductase [Mycoplasma capricolum subsp. capripneumoniae]|uniref:FMN-dependent NADH-azoreductase n=1 Tax=Mycoplasma capricolum TaxID=2095 RepID=UPI0004E7D4F2|nr:FMN-dependent NADH-azoreductase [Mycoplasma capricolum]QIN42750.1 FMN-dependent NADH-azoreductase [Mycoplasma capricolum subsp. capripneumoniae]QIN46180.1 FMN-dependent NADH-azoreductase [Mycoplasma capricolum subsp. capripneumoniae]QIN48247.1 FMN-dependent NADH-azoreductase [Mycoplasma capricolum subsp. capripneumoniae]QIN48933.1 FMN-dependent NADH-azoreductase [Mycoplasma capricolum subsp. capripneumoniae]QIN49621.1 FMN-dependent NADH-azoreductase [Mycoplasma capricolum subsp. capripneumo